MQDTRLPRQCCWRSECSEEYRCVARWVASDVSSDLVPSSSGSSNFFWLRDSEYEHCHWFYCKSYCSTVHFRRITSVYQPTNAHIISYKTLLKHFKTLRHVSILSDHHQGALFLAKVILQYSQFNSYLQTRCCGSILCCVGMCYGAVARCASYDQRMHI